MPIYFIVNTSRKTMDLFLLSLDFYNNKPFKCIKSIQILLVFGGVYGNNQ